MNPGVYANAEVSHWDYLAETDWISSSQLKAYLPEHFKPFTGSTSADFGSVFHQRFTGEEVPVRVVEAATWQGKAAQEAYAAAQAAGEYAILQRDVEALEGMEAATRKHPEASRLLVDLPGSWETSVFAEVDGVPSKCRFDRLLDGVGVDIKTTKAGPGNYALARTVIDYGYDVSALHYLEVAAAAGIELDSFKLVFISKEAPHHVTVATLDEAFLERGRALRDLALQRHLHPSMVDAYPGETEPIELSMPGWARL